MHEVHSGNARISRPLNRRAPGDRKRTWNNYPSCPRRPRIATLSQRRQAHNDTSAAAIVCKIAQFTQEAILGGKHGRGVASCRTTEGWSAPAFVSVGGGSWGLQIGVEGVDLVMLVMNDQGFQNLLSSKFELTGEGSVAAGPVGRHASAGTDWKMNTQMLTYSPSKGIFAGLTLEGAVVEQDNDSTRAIYGKNMEFRNILSGKAATPKSADAFMKARIRRRPTGKGCRSNRRQEVDEPACRLQA